MKQLKPKILFIFFLFFINNYLTAGGLGNPVCKEFFVNGEPAPCEGVEYTYNVNYNDNGLSQSGIYWIVNGGIITAIDGIPVDYSKVPATTVNGVYGVHLQTEYKNYDINSTDGTAIDEDGQTITEALYELFGGGVSKRLVPITVKWGNYYLDWNYKPVLIPSNGGQYTGTIHAAGYHLGFLELCGNRYDTKTVTITPGATLNANIKVTQVPTCTNGQFNFSVPYYDNCTYSWTVPQGWIIDGSGSKDNGYNAGNTISTSWANMITGTANRGAVKDLFQEEI